MKSRLNAPAPAFLLDHNEQHARYSLTDCFLEIVLETTDHLLVHSPILKEKKIKFLKKRKKQRLVIFCTLNVSIKFFTRTVSSCVLLNHLGNDEQKDMLLFKSHSGITCELTFHVLIEDKALL